MSVALRRHATREANALEKISETRPGAVSSPPSAGHADPAKTDTAAVRPLSATVELGQIIDVGDGDVVADIRLRIPLDTPESRFGLGSVLRLDPGLLRELALDRAEDETDAVSSSGPSRSSLCGSGRTSAARAGARVLTCSKSQRQRPRVKWWRV